MTNDDYRAAGVLPWRKNRHHNHRAEVLLAYEWNAGTRRCRYHMLPEGCRDSADDCEFPHLDGPTVLKIEQPSLRLNPLGGKRELDQEEHDSRQTAAREFHEESNGIVRLAEAEAFVLQATTHAVRIYGKYDLYVGPLHGELSDTELLPTVYELLDRHPPLACAYALYWWPVESLLAVSADIRKNFEVTHGPLTLPISHSLWSLCTKQPHVLRAIIY